MSFDLHTVFYLLIAAIALLLAWIVRLEIKLNRLLVGSGAKNLDQSLANIAKDIETMRKFQDEEKAYLTTVEKRLKKSVQAVEAVRFNPFKGTGTGSNQSFAIAFINEKGDGIVMSSLYTHDRTSIFSKPLLKYGSSFELTEEEKEAIAKAKETLVA